MGLNRNPSLTTLEYQMKTILILVLTAFLAIVAYDFVLSHVFVVSGVDMIGCATNRCVSVNDTTYLIK